MRPILHSRLQRVVRKLALVHRLRKVGLATEEELIDRMSERSKKVLLDIRGKFVRAFKALEPSLEEKGHAALSEVMKDILKVVTNDGRVESSALEEVKSSVNETWKTVSQTSKGSIPVLHFFNALDRYLTVAMLGSILQNPRMVERAKTSQKVRDKLYSTMEQMATVIPQVQNLLQKSQAELPAGPPSLPEKKDVQDSTQEEAVLKQLTDAEEEMRGIVMQLAKVIPQKAEELLGVGSDLSEALDENIFSIFHNRKVNPQLNRDRDFYQDALHLEHSPTRIDLGEFLDTKQKKAIYLCYRSFVMAVRALGVVQHAKANPELVIKNPKVAELVVKAHQILIKRKDTIVKYLQALKKPKKEEREKERGIPKGTFSDFFEKEPEAARA